VLANGFEIAIDPDGAINIPLLELEIRNEDPGHALHWMARELVQNHLVCDNVASAVHAIGANTNARS
jgi:hypothetical protein